MSTMHGSLQLLEQSIMRAGAQLGKADAEILRDIAERKHVLLIPTSTFDDNNLTTSAADASAVDSSDNAGGKLSRTASGFLDSDAESSDDAPDDWLSWWARDYAHAIDSVTRSFFAAAPPRVLSMFEPQACVVIECSDNQQQLLCTQSLQAVAQSDILVAEVAEAVNHGDSSHSSDIVLTLAHPPPPTLSALSFSERFRRELAARIAASPPPPTATMFTSNSALADMSGHRHHNSVDNLVDGISNNSIIISNKNSNNNNNNNHVVALTQDEGLKRHKSVAAMGAMLSGNVQRQSPTLGVGVVTTMRRNSDPLFSTGVAEAARVMSDRKQ